MNKVEDNRKKEAHVALSVVQQWVYVPDDEFEVKFIYKFYEGCDCLLKRIDQTTLVSSSWLSYQDYEYKEDQISIGQIVH
jgi:hypothetical protein